MSDLRILTNDKLADLIRETEGLLLSLKAEEQRREHLAQDRDIDNLEQHIENSEPSLSPLRDFVRYLMQHLP